MEICAVECTVWIAAPRERVWQALTEAAQLNQWYAPPCPWSVPALQIGAIVTFANTDTDIQRGTIEVAHAPSQLTLRWEPDPLYPTAALRNTFLLEEENGGTRVTITQAGYEELPSALRQPMIDADTGAYTTVAENLQAYLERRQMGSSR